MPDQDDIAQGLSQLGETTTAGELLRQKGQTRKLRVISERKLMDWILMLLKQHMAGKEDAFSDAEKEEMLRNTQAELNRRIKREQEAQAERDRLRAELDQAMAAVKNVQTSGEHAVDSAEMDRAIGALKQKLEEAEQINLDLQQDNYDLQDQLNEKMALLSTTISEKDKLNTTVQKQMRRMTDLVSAVMGIDADYYGNRHQEQNPPPEDMPEEDLFYHDFDVAPQVITTLLGDLERLRGIVQAKSQEVQAAESRAQVAEAHEAEAAAKPKLLTADLEMLEQLKAGSLEAVDVAAPVAALVEALDGARAEGEAFELQVAEATGVASAGVAFTELPESGGDPNHVLAGAATVARELAAALARNRNRIVALKSIADEADEARNETENDLEAHKAAFERVVTALRQRAQAERIDQPAAMADRQAHADDRAAAACEVVEHLQGASPVDVAAVEQLALTDRLISQVAGVAAPAPERQPDTTDRKQVADRLRRAGAELEKYTIDLQRQLEAATIRERQLAERVRALIAAQSATAAVGKDDLQLEPEGDAQLAALDRSLSVETAPDELCDATIKAENSHAYNGQRHPNHAAFEEDKAIAIELIKGAQGDPRLAEHLADLAVAADATDPATHADLAEQVRQALSLVLARKQELESEIGRLQSALDDARSATGDADVELHRLEAQNSAGQTELAKLQAENLSLRAAKDDLGAALDALANEVKARSVQAGCQASPEMAAADPVVRARAAVAAVAAIGTLADHAPAQDAAVDCLRSIDRILSRGGQRSALAEGLKPGDEVRTAERLRHAARELEKLCVSLNQELDAAKAREHELMQQTRDLGTGVAAAVVQATAGDPALVEHSTDLSLAVDNPQMASALGDELKRAVTQLGERRRALEAEATRLAAELKNVCSERAVATARADATERARTEDVARLEAELKHLAAELTQARAEVEDRSARNDATSVHFKGEVGNLRKELLDLRERAKSGLVELNTLRQSVDAAEVRLNRQREEMTKLLADRDRIIKEKDRDLDRLRADRVEAKALEAKVAALTTELGVAAGRIHDLESRLGDHAGDLVKAGDITELQQRLAAERDALREQKRQVEADLADVQAVTDELRSELNETRKSAQLSGARHLAELNAERERNAQVMEDMRKFREEVVGLRARLRKLSEPMK